MADTLTVSVRIHDPQERKNAEKSTRWVILEVPREDLQLSDEDFLAKWIAEAVAHIKKIGQ